MSNNDNSVANADERKMTEEEYLAQYDMRKYSPVGLTVDLAIFTIEDSTLKILAIKRGGHPDMGKWALPGGFVNVNESLDKAALRELQEETGIDARGWLEQLKTYGNPYRDPRGYVASVAYVAFVPELKGIKAGDDADHAELINVNDVITGDIEMAFDHDVIIKDGLERVRAKIEYAPIAPDFIPHEKFTLSELRNVYEIVWGIRVGAPNFRRKVLSVKDFVVEAEGKRRSDVPAGRQSDLFMKGDAVEIFPPLRRN